MGKKSKKVYTCCQCKSLKDVPRNGIDAHNRSIHHDIGMKHRCSSCLNVFSTQQELSLHKCNNPTKGGGGGAAAPKGGAAANH